MIFENVEHLLHLTNPQFGRYGRRLNRCDGPHDRFEIVESLNAPVQANFQILFDERHRMRSIVAETA